MKALIRNPGETITEDMNISGIDWTTGYPLTSPDWADGPYTLIQNYVPPPEPIYPEDPIPSLGVSYTEETTQTSPTQISQTVTLTAEEVEALRTALNTLGK